MGRACKGMRRNDERWQMRRLSIPVMIALAVFGGPAATVAARPAAAGFPVLVIAADPEAVVARAGGTPVAPISAPLGTLAAAGDPDFIQRLRDGGAWLVLDGRVLAAICGVAA